MAFVFKYPKLLILLLCYLIAFFVFSFLSHILEYSLTTTSYLGIFVAGTLYTYSFTSGIATIALLILAQGYSPLLISIIGGLGAGLADLTIMRFLNKYNLETEINNLLNKKYFKKFHWKIFQSGWLGTLLGLIIISSPLPDELGVLCINKGKILTERQLFFIGFVANAIGIYIITSLAR